MTDRPLTPCPECYRGEGETHTLACRYSGARGVDSHPVYGGAGDVTHTPMPTQRPGTVNPTRCEGDDIEALERMSVQPTPTPVVECRGWAESDLEHAAHLDWRSQAWQRAREGTGTAEPPRTIVEPVVVGGAGGFITRDSGKRAQLSGGMVRDTDEGKPRYDLIPLLPLRRLAELYARGAVKYEARNWERANDVDALERFKGSGLRHYMQALEGDRSEDHWSAVVFNVFGAIWLEDKLERAAQ